MELTIGTAELELIIDHCVKSLPNEACGILAGRSGVVETVYSMRNARPGPVSYEMEPEEQFRVLKEIRRTGRELVGIFHSHPSSPAYPSAVDVEHAYWPGTLFPNYPGAAYLIVSLMERSVPVMRGFRIEEGTVEELSVTVLRREQ